MHLDGGHSSSGYEETSIQQMRIDPADISEAITQIDELIAVRRSVLKSIPTPELKRTDGDIGRPIDIVRNHLSAVRREKYAIRILNSVRKQLAKY